MSQLKLRWIALLLGAVATLSIPAFTIRSYYTTLTQGSIAKFALVPIDPYDPFRGRYVWLRLESAPVPAASPADAEGLPSEAAYLSYTLDQSNFAQPVALHLKPPAEAPYLKVQGIFAFDENTYDYRLPFDRYYLNEKDAPLAEDLAREAVRPFEGGVERQAEPSYLVLRVHRGNAVIEALFVGGKPIEERIR